jgi:serine/threonine-protein kinase
VLFAAGGIVAAVGVVVAALAVFPLTAPAGTGGGRARSDGGIVTATQTDQPLPTGLTVARRASYDPTARRVTVEFDLSAQKAPLEGAILQVIPGLSADAPCPGVVWDGVDAARNRSATTGITVPCGWALNDVAIPANGTITVRAALAVDAFETAALGAWLQDHAERTAAAVDDPDVKGAAYPLQRLRGLSVETPMRVVAQTALPIAVFPRWPGGVDRLTPLYQSPSVGTSSQLLRSVAGGEEGVRFADGCGGGIAVSVDGLTATTLAITSNCRVRATVGNLDTESAPFGITARS